MAPYCDKTDIYTHCVTFKEFFRKSQLQTLNAQRWCNLPAVCRKKRRKQRKKNTKQDFHCVYKKIHWTKAKVCDYMYTRAHIEQLISICATGFLVQVVFLFQTILCCCWFFFAFLLCWFLNKHFAFEQAIHRDNQIVGIHNEFSEWNQNHSSFERAKYTLFMISLGFCVSLQHPKITSLMFRKFCQFCLFFALAL